MNAAVLTSSRHIEVKDVRLPPLDDGAILVDVLAAGVCGSDAAAYLGTHPYKKPPIVLGHELCGRVRQVSPGVTGVSVGDHVCALSFKPCGKCDACVAEHAHLCAQKHPLSHRGWQGEFAERVILGRGMYFRIRADVMPDAACLAEPLSIGIHAVGLAGEPASMAILGSGSVGLMSLLAARRSGVGSVVMTDLGDEKCARARRLGATAAVDANAADIPSRVREHLNGGADAVLIAAGYPDAFDDAIEIVRPGGTVVVVAYFVEPVHIEPNVCVLKEVAIRFSCMSNGSDLRAAIAFIESQPERVLAVVSHRFDLTDAARAIDLVASGDASVGKAIIRVDESTCTGCGP